MQKVLLGEETKMTDLVLRKAHHMLVAAYSSLNIIERDQDANIPVCVEIALAFIGYAKESIVGVILNDWDEKEMVKRINKSYDDAVMSVHVCKMRMRGSFAKGHYKWAECEDALRVIKEHTKKLSVK